MANERDDGLELLDLTVCDLDRSFEPLEPFSRLPFVDAIDAVRLACAAHEAPSGIERFICRVLGKVDVGRLRTLAASRRMALAFIERMDAFFLNFDQEGITPADRAVLYAAETAVNRIYRVLCLLGFGLAPVSASPSEEACSAYDQAVYAGVTLWVERLMGESSAENPWAKIGSVACIPGGRWDVLTRCAALCEQIGLVVHLDYRVRCSPDCRALRIEFAAPGAPCMPASTYDLAEGAWRTLADADRAAWAREYAARMMLVLAAAAFASGFAIERCVIAATDTAGGESCEVSIERGWFAARLSALARELDGCSIAEPVALAALDELPGRDDSTADAPVSPQLLIGDAAPPAPADDDRALPPALRDLLLADTASELEVMEGADDPYMARLKELAAGEHRDAAAAERGYAELIDELEARCALRELLSDTPVITRFCESYVGRIQLPVFEEDRSVRILRAPDALFFARLALCRLYIEVEAYDRALPEARRLLDLAPTSMQAHAMLVNVLARLERFDEVIEVVHHGLRVAFEREAIAYLLYRGAFAYWSQGDRETAAACYRLVRGGGSVDALAERELRELLHEQGTTAPPTVEEAVQRLRAQGFACAPWSDGFMRVVDAAVLLTDAGFSFLAARCVHALWHLLGRDELGVVSRALL